MATFVELATRTHAHACLGCGKCTGSCPLAELGSGQSPRALVAEALGGRRELATHERLRGWLYNCLTCGACEERCPEGVDYIDFVRGVRASQPASDRAPCPHHQILEYAARLMDAERPEDAKRPAWLDRDLRVADKGPVYLFVGCLPLFDVMFGDLGVRTLDIARSAIRLLNSIGIEPVVSGAEVCCGHDLLWSGNEEGFQALAKRNAALFKQVGAETVLTTCAECARTLTKDLPAAVPGTRVKVEHLSSYLAEHLEELGVSQATSGTDGNPARVTYHDPCRLGRHLGVYEPPRQVIDELPGVERVEMAASGRDAVCCGTSGFIHCDAMSRLMQARRLSQAAATGAEYLVTACPKCLIHFNCAQAETARRADVTGASRPDSKIELVDWTVLTSSVLMKGGLGRQNGNVAGTEPASGDRSPAAVTGETR